MNVDQDQFSIYPDTGKMEFPICIMPNFVKPDLNAANARLIAVAPDLLEALNEQVTNCFDPTCEMCRKHEALIRKAKGEEE